MSRRIFLTSEPGKVDVPRGDTTLWVVPERSAAPDARRWCFVADFMESTVERLRGVASMVVVGLVSKITTPANRVKTGQYLTDPLPGVTRYSIDDKLFIVDPWRMWWHFGCVGVAFNECFTSYRLESRWKAFLEDKEPNPCTPELLERYGKGVVSAVNPFRFEPVTMRVLKAPVEVHEAYLREKVAAFDEEPTIVKIMARLAAFAQGAMPQRVMPGFRELFDSPAVRVAGTDLGIDRYLMEQIRLRVDLVNFAAREFAS